MNSNGNTIDRDGRLITCEHSARRVTRTELDGSITIIADKYNGKKLNSPNDVVVAADGPIWFTDPRLRDHGATTRASRPSRSRRNRTSTGSIRSPATIKVVVDDFVEPNGLAFSPDEKKLYIVDTGYSDGPDNPPHIRVFDVDLDSGKLANGKVFAGYASPASATACAATSTATSGAPWAGATRTRTAFAATAPDGDLIGKIHIPETFANLCFGGRSRTGCTSAARPRSTPSTRARRAP